MRAVSSGAQREVLAGASGAVLGPGLVLGNPASYLSDFFFFLLAIAVPYTVSFTPKTHQLYFLSVLITGHQFNIYLKEETHH